MSKGEDSRAIQQALEALPNIGAGNVEVSALQGADFDGRFFIRFKGVLGEQDIAPLTMQGANLRGSIKT